MFKIKKSTKMSKVFKAYASRKGVEESALRFLLDGERISDTDTPKMLELEDEDQIDCVLQQVGGASDDEGGGGDAKPEGGNEPITIRVSECIYFGVCVWCVINNLSTWLCHFFILVDDVNDIEYIPLTLYLIFPYVFVTEDQNGEETMFKIKKTTKMKKVFATYAARKGVEATASE